jgi:hypothetical protein
LIGEYCHEQKLFKIKEYKLKNCFAKFVDFIAAIESLIEKECLIVNSL